MMNTIQTVLQSSNELLYFKYIQSNKKRLSWKWEEFDFYGSLTHENKEVISA